MPHRHGFLHHLGHEFDQALEVEAFTRAHISCSAMASSSSWLCADKSVPLGRDWWIRPLIFSLLPRP